MTNKTVYTDDINYTITLESSEHGYGVIFQLKGWNNVHGEYYFSGRGDKPFQIKNSNNNVFYYIIRMYQLIAESEDINLQDMEIEQADLIATITNLTN